MLTLQYHLPITTNTRGFWSGNDPTTGRATYLIQQKLHPLGWLSYFSQLRMSSVHVLEWVYLKENVLGILVFKDSDMVLPDLAARHGFTLNLE